MRNWKTTVSGIVSALAMFIVTNPNVFPPWPWLVPAAKFVLSGGLLALGISGKDASTHSTAAEVAASTEAQPAAQDKP